MASSGPLYFYEDEVFRANRNGDIEFGMVSENWEMYSSDDDDDPVRDPNKVPPGHVSVTWYPKGKEEIIRESKVCSSYFVQLLKSHGSIKSFVIQSSSKNTSPFFR